MDSQSKAIHEQFILNEEGTSPQEVLSLSSLNQLSHLLLVLIFSAFPCLADHKANESWRIGRESLVLFAPFILSTTLLSDFWLLSCPLLVILCVYVLVKYLKAQNTLQWTEILFIAKKGKNWRLPLLTNLYCNLMISVCISILAVDFPAFPRRLAKTEIYGWSLMDTGVGAFVAINGALSPEARLGADLRPVYLFKKTLLSCLPILVLGFQRLALVKGLNYHEHITEYGVHWNFFFTLAFTKIFSTAFCCFCSKRLRAGYFGAILLVIHQLLLSLGLKEYIQNDNREGLISANKEGLISLPGYVALYLFFVEIGGHITRTRNTGKSRDYLLLAFEMWVVSIGSTGVMLLSHLFVENVSRREANLGFICWMIALITFLVGLEALLLLITEMLQFMGFIANDANRRSLVMEAIEYNGLFVFLAANLLTGLTNFAFDTMASGDLFSVLVLIVYSTVLCLLAVYLFRRKIKFKIPQKYF